MTDTTGEERTDTITVEMPTDTGLLDAEDDLYQALGRLQDYRQTEDRDKLLKAELAVMKAYFSLNDQIAETNVPYRGDS